MLNVRKPKWAMSKTFTYPYFHFAGVSKSSTHLINHFQAIRHAAAKDWLLFKFTEPYSLA